MRGTPWIFNLFRNNTIEQHGRRTSFGRLVSLRGNGQMFSERLGPCPWRKIPLLFVASTTISIFFLPSLSGQGLRTIVLKSKLFLYSSKKLFLLLGCVTSVIYFKRIVGAIKILRNLGRKFEKFRIIIRDTPPTRTVETLLKRGKCPLPREISQCWFACSEGKVDDFKLYFNRETFARSCPDWNNSIRDSFTGEIINIFVVKDSWLKSLMIKRC